MSGYGYMTGYTTPGTMPGQQGTGNMSAWPVVGAGINAIGGLLSGQQQYDPKNAGDVHLANIGQSNLWNALAGKVNSGAGDFGMGAATKTGKSQLAQFMADRGINPQGGAGLAGYSQMLGTAGAQANQNRLGYALNLLRSPLQTVQTAGSNWLPDSPSMGYDSDAQWKHFATNRKRDFRNQAPGGSHMFSYGPNYNQDGR